MPDKKPYPFNALPLLFAALVTSILLSCGSADGQETRTLNLPDAARKTPEERSFKKKIEPLLKKY